MHNQSTNLHKNWFHQIEVFAQTHLKKFYRSNNGMLLEILLRSNDTFIEFWSIEKEHPSLRNIV